MVKWILQGLTLRNSSLCPIFTTRIGRLTSMTSIKFIKIEFRSNLIPGTSGE